MRNSNFNIIQTGKQISKYPVWHGLPENVNITMKLKLGKGEMFMAVL